MNVLAHLAPAMQQGDAGAAAGSSLIGAAFGIFVIVCIWMIFGKAGQPGWYSIIPLWNTIVMLRIAGRPWWWIILLLIPLVNIVILVMAMISLGRSFGRGALFSILMLTCISPIGFAILAFGGSRYLGPGGRGF